MHDELSFAEIDGLLVELLHARTVLSLFSAGTRGGGGNAGNSNGGNGGLGDALVSTVSDTLGRQVDSAGTGVGGAGGSANAGRG
jgi:hypothetical protein